MMTTFLGLMLFSCSKNTTEVASVDFQKMYYENGNHRGNQQSNARESNIRHIILRLELGRPKTKPDCTGFGVCSARWFFCEDENGVEVPCTGGTFEQGVFEGNPIYDSSTDRYYLDILFTQSVEGVPSEDLVFVVDQDWVFDTEERYGFDLTIPQGNYEYNASLGEFGGTRIYITE